MTLNGKVCRQHGHVIKSAVITIDTVSVQNLLAPFCCVLGENTLRHFPLAWRSSQAVLNFSHICIKLKNQNKKLQSDSNSLASPEASRGDCLFYVLKLPAPS